MTLYPTEWHRPVRFRRPRRLRWCAVIGVGCLAVVAACTGSDDGRSDDTAARSLDVSVAMPSAEELAGFTHVRLASAEPASTGSGSGAEAPQGDLWYRVGSSTGDDQGASFEWYVHATHLQPARAYRLDLTVDGNTIYSIGSGGADARGTMTSHGTATGRFADQYCVGAPAPPLPVAGRHALSLIVKSDGSGSGPASTAGPLTDPGRSYPCHGNGDGVFEFWLMMRAPITIGGHSAH